MNEEQIRHVLQRRLLPTLDERVVLQRIARKVERAFERLGTVEASGTQAITHCGGIVCREGEKYYVETGIVGIDLLKFGGDGLYDRLNGKFVN